MKAEALCDGCGLKFPLKDMVTVPDSDCWADRLVCKSCVKARRADEVVSTFEEALDTILAEMRGVMIAKQHDYGPGNIAAFGEFGVLVRASDKLERLKNLLHNGQQPNNESLDDTWLDLANYGLIGLMVRRGLWGLPLADKEE